jgi:hypothetical protein
VSDAFEIDAGGAPSPVREAFIRPPRDETTRLRAARLLGHKRPQVTGCYVGSNAAITPAQHIDASPTTTRDAARQATTPKARASRHRCERCASIVGVDDSRSLNYFGTTLAQLLPSLASPKAHSKPQRRGGTDMNCRFAPIDARTSSVMRSLVNIQTLTGMALQHSPGEGSGAPS